MSADPNRFQNVVDSLPCRRQSLHKVLRKTADKFMRNANKSPKMPYSTMVRKVEKRFGIRIRDRITTKN